MKSLKLYILSLLSVAIGLAVPSCGMVGEEPVPDPAGETKVRAEVQFTLSGTVSPTRADSDPSHTEISELEYYESQINVGQNDYLICIFDGHDASSRLIFKSGNFDLSGSAPTPDGFWPANADFKVYPGGEGIYNFNFSDEFIANSQGKTWITIVVLANLYGAGSDYSFSYAMDGNTTLADFDAAAKAVSFSFKQEVTENDHVGEGAWEMGKFMTSTNPLVNDKVCLIPMYGRKDYELNLPTTGEKAFVDLTNNPIHMLRALGKFQLVDATVKDSDGYPRITSVRFLSKTQSSGGCVVPNGLVVPTLSDFADGFQVTTPTFPADLGTRYIATGIPLNGYIMPYPDNPASLGQYDYWTVYSPEMNLINGVSAVEVVYVPRKGQSASTVVYALNSLGNNGGGSFTGNILRNHIYRIVVQELASATIGMKWTVCPFDTPTVDIPTFQ